MTRDETPQIGDEITFRTPFTNPHTGKAAVTVRVTEENRMALGFSNETPYVQWFANGFVTSDADDADLVRLWDDSNGDATCIAEYSLVANGTWGLTGSDVCMLADDRANARTFASPHDALTFARAWSTRDESDWPAVPVMTRAEYDAAAAAGCAGPVAGMLPATVSNWHAGFLGWDGKHWAMINSPYVGLSLEPVNVTDAP